MFLVAQLDKHKKYNYTMSAANPKKLKVFKSWGQGDEIIEKNKD